MIKDDVEAILKMCGEDKALIVEHLQELVEQFSIDHTSSLAELIEMILPENIYYPQFSEDLDRLMPHIDMEIYCKIHVAVEMFILKVLIELKINTGKEINFSI